MGFLLLQKIKKDLFNRKIIDKKAAPILMALLLIF
jgi:hypothetical protein